MRAHIEVKMPLSSLMSVVILQDQRYSFRYFMIQKKLLVNNFPVASLSVNVKKELQF